MQLAAAGRCGGEKRLKKLDGGGDDYRGIPVFRNKLKSRFLLFILVRGRLHTGVVLQYHIIPKDPAVLGSVLLDDGKIRNYHDDAAQAVALRVGKRKCHCRKRLTAPGRHRKRKEALRYMCLLKA